MVYQISSYLRGLRIETDLNQPVILVSGAVVLSLAAGWTLHRSRISSLDNDRNPTEDTNATNGKYNNE